VCAILRGEKLVVAGDRNQLPPTTFFAAGDDDLDSEEETGAAEGFESLLDMANAFLSSNYLDWHYRSRDEFRGRDAHYCAPPHRSVRARFRHTAPTSGA